MLHNSVAKGEKGSMMRTRRSLYVWLLLLMMTMLMLAFYNLSPQLSRSLTFWRASLWSTKADNMAALESVVSSTAHYFVPYPHPYHFILDEPTKCRQESPFLVLMIPVAPQNKEARDTIRSTWGKETTVLGRAVSHYFIMGLAKDRGGTEPIEQQMLHESQQQHDLLQSDFLDSYNNLTIKTMVMFEWLTSHCPNTSYAMKVDSDIFLNVHKLVEILFKAPQHLYMTGMVMRGSAVLRDPSSKWYLPVSAFAEPYYPPYILGMGYVFSMDLAKRITEASLHIKALYIEDVYVGLCMRHLGITVTDPPSGNLFKTSVTYFWAKCYWTTIITTILESPKKLLDTWREYETEEQNGC